MGVVFALFSGFYYWFPLFTGVGLNSFLGKVHFYTTFVGVNLTFLPQHFLGLAGIPRRYRDYPDCYYLWNKVSSLGSYISVFAVLLFVFIIWESLVSCRTVIFVYNHPVHLEWSQITPLSHHTFEEFPKFTLSTS
jgi:heme/copper-type cytochrome/quinol oxidase subunit 1